MSFLKRLFGGGGPDKGKPANPAFEAEYEGFAIVATPQNDGGQFRLCAVVSKEIDGETKSHKLIRADLFPSAGDAAEAALRKARQVIDEQGDKLLK